MGYDSDRLNAIYDKTGGYCHLCDKKLSFTNHGKQGAKGAWHVDHSKPKAKGGTNHMNNLFPSCISCNIEKGTLHKSTIRKRKGYESESSSGGGCYITTACVTSEGLSDDCHELEVLRDFRDTYVASTSDGATLIHEYYKTAPLIVDQINKRENSGEIYSAIYVEIKKAVSLIENKMYSTAFEFYCKIVHDLKRDFLVG
jgi:hypothetical protein